MTIYSVFQSRDAADIQGEPVVVAEKFSWFAFLLPPLFFLRHAMWFKFIGFVVAVSLLWQAAGFIGTGAAFWLYVLFALWLGWEAPALRRARLQRANYVYQSDVIAAGADMAQVEWLQRKTYPA